MSAGLQAAAAAGQGAPAAVAQREQPVAALDVGPRYEALAQLGQGAFGVVVQARERCSGSLVALKLLARGPYFAATAASKPYLLYVGREVLHQASLYHPFVLQLYEVFLTPQHLALSMEYADGGSLLAHLQAQPGRRLAEPAARWLFQQLAIGLAYTHLRGVANRDLKLENLLLCRNGDDPVRPLLKIGDFGYSKHDYNSSAHTRCGTQAYMAPEVLSCTGSYDAKKADVWSAGVILFTCLAGCFPWKPGDPGCVQRMVAAQYEIPIGVEVSAPCRDLLSRMLTADPEARWGMDQVMQHPWFLQDLPPGAQQMNAFYLGSTPRVDSAAPQVAAILQAAAAPGAAGEPPMACRFSAPPASPAGSGTGAAQARPATT